MHNNFTGAPVLGRAIYLLKNFVTIHIFTLFYIQLVLILIVKRINLYPFDFIKRYIPLN